MHFDLRRDEPKIGIDELPPQRRVIAAQAFQPFLRCGNA
jgi:hypothetical protein